MNNTPHNAPEPAENRRNKNSALDLSTASSMLPLVRSIVSEIVRTRQALVNLSKEQDHLDRNRRQLGWAERRRRYAVREELEQAEKNLSSAVSELGQLGITLVDPDAGTVDFPTRINGRPAAFSWMLGEDGLSHWRYVEEQVRRPIPTDWRSASVTTRLRDTNA